MFCCVSTIYIYKYMCVCVCVCVDTWLFRKGSVRRCKSFVKRDKHLYRYHPDLHIWHDPIRLIYIGHMPVNGRMTHAVVAKKTVSDKQFGRYIRVCTFVVVHLGLFVYLGCVRLQFHSNFCRWKSITKTQQIDTFYKTANNLTSNHSINNNKTNTSSTPSIYRHFII